MTEKSEVILSTYALQAGSIQAIGPERFSYALIMCLSGGSLVDFYFSHFEGILENQIVGIIRKRLEEGRLDQSEKFASAIIQLMSETDYGRSYRKLRAHTRKFIPHWGRTERTAIFDHLVDSHRKSDRKVACEASFEIWDIGVESRLWEAWYRWEGEHVAATLAEKGNPTRLCEVVRDVWEKENISIRVKRSVAQAVAKHDIREVEFIAGINSLTYFHLALLAEEDVPDRKAEQYVTGAANIDELQFGIYLLGKAGKWDLLTDLSKELLNEP